MKQKKLMLLGGLRYLLPVIEAAHKLGIYVITCDYIPENIAHKYSDEYHNVSIVDKEAVLALAKKLQIDGIMSFAVDPGVLTASYVQTQMGLPAFGPYESVEILQNKDKFRAFLAEHNFVVPKAKGYATKEDALVDASSWEFPVIVKPTDSAGSKGVSRVDNAEQMIEAIDYAFDHSISGHIIIEDFIEKQGCSSDSDCFSVDGKLKFVSFSAQRFDANAANEYTPAAYSWPSTMTAKQEAELTSELQRLLDLLHMHSSVYNVETRVGTDGKCYIMEVSPRGGGNRLSEMLKMATGVDLITAAVCAAVGMLVNVEQKPYKGNWAEVILHAKNDGTFISLDVNRDFYNNNVIQTDLWVKRGDKVSAFRAANDSIGTLVVKFNTLEDLLDLMNQQDAYINIIVNNRN